MGKNVEIIKATQDVEHGYKLRVGAYCRVSTDSEDQANSFLSQMQYYSDYINNNADMVFVDLYADEGITGTSIKKRVEFQRMIKDCEAKRLDRILVKSVTRFARNSLECIESIRKMKECGVTVFFENDNIDTATMNSEMMLYIKSAFAQGEVTSAAKRMRKSVCMRMEEGSYKNAKAPYGYKFDGEKFVIQAEQARVVRKIFQLYLSGMGYEKITKYLNENGLDKTINWKEFRVRQMIINERYIGDCLFGKYYTPDVFPFSKKRNNGESNKFYYYHTHEAIIERDVFDKVQQLRLKKKSKFLSDNVNNNFLKGKIYCKHCGWAYQELYKGNKLYWRCGKKGHIDGKCHAPTYSNDKIEETFIKMFNTLKCNNKILLGDALKQIQYLKMRANLSNPDIQKLDKQLLDLKDKNNMYEQLYSNNILNRELYFYNKNKIEKEIDELRARRKSLSKEENHDSSEIILVELNKIIEETDFLLKFDSALFDKMVDKIFIEQSGDITYILNGGIELSEKIKEE